MARSQKQRRTRRRLGLALRGLVFPAALAAAGVGLATLAGRAEALETTTLTPAADSYASAVTPTKQHGSRDVLKIDADPAKVSYLRFVLPASGPLARAELRLLPRDSGAAITVHEVLGPWVEEELTFENAPALSEPRATSGPVTPGNWISIDVTAVVAGKTTVELALSTSTRSVDVYSREAGAESAPKLVLETDGSGGTTATTSTATTATTTTGGTTATTATTTTPTTTTAPTTTTTAPTTTTTSPTTTTVTTPPPPSSPGERRPYSADSPWNVPIGSRPALHPESAAIVAALASGRTFTSDPTQYTYPVYEVSTDTPRVPVFISGVFTNALSDDVVQRLSDATVEVPIPAEAQAAAGTDAQIVIVDWATGDEWGFWRLAKDSSGRWSATNGSHYNVNWRGALNTWFSARGAGIPYLAGLVRPWEIAQGRIEHALAFAYDYPSPAFIYPATKSDGKGTDLAAVPEGTRLQLDPAFDVSSLANPIARIVARALQEYGMYVVDNSGRAKTYFEYEGTANWDGRVTASTVSQIPLSRFRVLSPIGTPTTTTPPPPADLSVTVTSPAAGATVSGWTRLNVAYTGAVAKVAYRVDGVRVAEDTTPSDFSEPWNSATVGNGTHVVTAVATTLEGSSITSPPVTITTRN